MSNFYDGRKSKDSKHCRWCGTQYYAVKPHGKDGFCTTAHKQAHHRAYKNYVTQTPRRLSSDIQKRVTQKKKKRKTA